jgi:hypothetical protein
VKKKLTGNPVGRSKKIVDTIKNTIRRRPSNEITKATKEWVIVSYLNKDKVVDTCKKYDVSVYIYKKII